MKLPRSAMMSRRFDERVGFDALKRRRFRHRRASLGARAHHQPLPAREEGSERGRLRARQADRLLRRSGHAVEVGAVREGRASSPGSRRSRRRDSRNAIQAQDAPRERSGVEHRGRTLLVRSLGADAERKRRRSSRIRAAARSCRQPSTCTRASRASARSRTSSRPRRSTSARSSCRCPTRSSARSCGSRSRTRSATRSACRTTSRPARSTPLAQVRDPKWVKENGFVPSIMDDARFNYVAQPEDGLDPADLIPKLGPYDKFAISWGYKPVPSAKTAQAERTTLDQWARQQDATPYLRFSTEGAAASDPGENPEAVGDADAVTATTLGLKNLAKVSDLMFKATSTKVGDPWDDLEAVYNRMVGSVGHRDESRRQGRRRPGVASDSHRPAGRPLQDGRQGQAGRSAAVPRQQRVHGAGVHGPDRRAAPDSAERRGRARSHGTDRGADGAAAEPADRSHDRAVDD